MEKQELKNRIRLENYHRRARELEETLRCEVAKGNHKAYDTIFNKLEEAYRGISESMDAYEKNSIHRSRSGCSRMGKRMGRKRNYLYFPKRSKERST